MKKKMEKELIKKIVGKEMEDWSNRNFLSQEEMKKRADRIVREEKEIENEEWRKNIAIRKEKERLEKWKEERIVHGKELEKIEIEEKKNKRWGIGEDIIDAEKFRSEIYVFIGDDEVSYDAILFQSIQEETIVYSFYFGECEGESMWVPTHEDWSDEDIALTMKGKKL